MNRTEDIRRVITFAVYEISVIFCIFWKEKQLEGHEVLFLSLVVSFLILLSADKIVRWRYGVLTRITIRNNPLAWQGSGALAILFVVGYFLDQRSQVNTNAEIRLYSTVVFLGNGGCFIS